MLSKKSAVISYRKILNRLLFQLVDIMNLISNEDADILNDLFSVIILSYNNYSFLQTCIDSVLMQAYKRIELIVVDDKSQEFDIKSVNSYISERKDSNLINFVVYQNPVNYGTVKSINCALKKVKGKYVKLLAADDALFNKEVLVQAGKALQNSKNGIITSDMMKCNSALTPISIYHKPFQKKINQFTSQEYFRRLCMRNGIVAGGVFFNAEFFEKFGFFDERYRLLEDWPTWLRLAKKGIRIEYYPLLA